MVKFYIDISGFSGWFLMFLILALIGMLVANQFRPVELYVEKRILEEMINGEDATETDEPPAANRSGRDYSTAPDPFETDGD